MRALKMSTTTWGSGTVRIPARVLGGPMTMRPSTSGAARLDVKATGGQIDVLDAEADEFRPAQAGVGHARSRRHPDPRTRWRVSGLLAR